MKRAGTRRLQWAVGLRAATGLLYIDSEAGDLHDRVKTVDRPLNELREAELCPGSKAIEAINASLR